MEIKFGHVYQDGEGTLMLAAENGEDAKTTKFYVFANHAPVPGDHPLVVHPLSEIFDLSGNNNGDKLRYPNGIGIRQ